MQHKCIPGQHLCGKILSWSDKVHLLEKNKKRLYFISPLLHNSVPISPIGCLTPISLLTAITDTSAVSGRIEDSNSF